jgi:hypothetical protein
MIILLEVRRWCFAGEGNSIPEPSTFDSQITSMIQIFYLFHSITEAFAAVVNRFTLHVGASGNDIRKATLFVFIAEDLGCLRSRAQKQRRNQEKIERVI